ncbi:hypothetical protein GCM10023084_69080 [Streptomyces lacrimifluminis]|uniref:Uncharacterized protein n=1 Tax=Streptomyces lacrimifluminis TaxID=1500077 RepID=A0A917P411_9ACTN|nr:hypothetical protein [Streptomyces lacrimifluminis]GGJ60571.1 hypothetical protein GCM10012282_67300 [Streptomyces lacrimifluminis]
MGNWAVVSQYGFGEAYVTEFVCSGLETKEQALAKLRAVLRTYLPRKSIRERWRHVYRFTDQETYLVVIKGATSTFECTLRVAELISDSPDSTVAARARARWEDRRAGGGDGPQDRTPPGR